MVSTPITEHDPVFCVHAVEAARGLFPLLLGERWFALPPCVRALHGSEASVRARGRASVDGGAGVLARCVRALLRMPAPAPDVALEVEIRRDGGNEIWRRQFAGRLFESRLQRSARWPDAFEERIGPMRLSFAPQPTAEGLLWAAREVRLLALRLPLHWFAGMQASCGERERRYRFDIDVRVPLIGELIAYSGWLEVVDDA
jgi:hypothetical protein